ncbi:hypothetical protein GS415_06945 [Rhodococcus hoagii]|nr:hypothetical protein [Prescottella equi]
MIPGVPPLGGVANEILRPLYTDVVLAFGKWDNITRAQRMGWSHYHERFQEGADRAYNRRLAPGYAHRPLETREQHSVTLEVADGAPWKIGQNGFGHYFLGDRIGFSPSRRHSPPAASSSNASPSSPCRGIGTLPRRGGFRSASASTRTPY